MSYEAVISVQDVDSHVELVVDKCCDITIDYDVVISLNSKQCDAMAKKLLRASEHLKFMGK